MSQWGVVGVCVIGFAHGGLVELDGVGQDAELAVEFALCSKVWGVVEFAVFLMVWFGMYWLVGGGATSGTAR